MSFVFRAHTEGQNRIECWQETQRIERSNLESFPPEPIGKDSSKIGTSIPSPFARLHLFQTAFSLVNKRGHDGQSPYHELVSDCLDTIQLLYLQGNDPKITFKVWTVEERIKKMQSDKGNNGQFLLGKTLDVFLNQSTESPLANLTEITLIYYNNKLLGGTSPFTLFFTTPNWRSKMNAADLDLTFGTNDTFYDDGLKALHEREQEFQAFLLQFIYANYSLLLKTGARDFIDYVEQSIRKYNSALNDLMDGNWGAMKNDQALLHVGEKLIPLKIRSEGSSYLNILKDVQFQSVPEENKKAKIQNNSDFLIKANPNSNYAISKNGPDNYTPLVVVPNMNLSGNYVDGEWKSNTFVPIGEVGKLTERTLPGTVVKYPYVSVDDFLESVVIQLPFNIQEEKFYTGCSEKSPFLIPIKKKYFEFFSFDDLKQNFNLEIVGGMVNVKLKIPITGKEKIDREIIFNRSYDLTNKEQILKVENGMGFFPFYQVEDRDSINEYYVMWADNNSEEIFCSTPKFFQLDDLKTSIEAKQESLQTRSPKSDFGASTTYLHLKKSFDFIVLNFNNKVFEFEGLIFPNFTKINTDTQTNNFHFAIDFGTSNTHISCFHQGMNTPEAFSIGEQDMQMVLLNEPSYESTNLNDKYNFVEGFPTLLNIIRREFVPSIIGVGGSDITFPIRTATSEKPSFSKEQENAIFSNINIGFSIDSEPVLLESLEFTTNLKWVFENLKDNISPRRVEAFLNMLFLLIKNKILLNNGNLNNSKIIWLAPQSMNRRVLNELEDKFSLAYKKVFPDQMVQLIGPVEESVAPYHYLTINNMVVDSADLVNIDIGGGTTDIMFFLNQSEDKFYSSSFKFAANDIWGAGFKRMAKDNGFITNLLKTKGNGAIDREEEKYLSRMLKDPNLSSEDVTSLLFKYDKYFNFSDSIRRGQPQLLMSMYLHYSAIVYHMVQLIEQKEIEIPRFFTFTGKGSQYLKIMAGKSRDVRDYTILLLKAFTDKPIHQNFDVVLIENPKEATANGAVLSATNGAASIGEIEEIIHQGTLNKEAELKSFKGDKIERENIDGAFSDSILTNFSRFIELTFKNREILQFLKDFGVEPNHFSEILFVDHTNNGIFKDSFDRVIFDLRKNQADISETFFFFPLKDALYQLSKIAIKENV